MKKIDLFGIFRHICVGDLSMFVLSLEIGRFVLFEKL